MEDGVGGNLSFASDHNSSDLLDAILGADLGFEWDGRGEPSVAPTLPPPPDDSAGDSDGDDQSNLDLSKRRAASVKSSLSKDFGVDASRMLTDGKGESEPSAPNTTPEGKANNRRVEFLKL